MSTKKTPTQKYIDEALKQIKDDLKKNKTEISHCEFAAAKFDASAMEVIMRLTEASERNALLLNTHCKSLADLTSLFSNQVIEMDHLIKVDANNTTIKGCMLSNNSKFKEE